MLVALTRVVSGKKAEVDECGSVLQIERLDLTHGLGVGNRRINQRQFVGCGFAYPLKLE